MRRRFGLLLVVAVVAGCTRIGFVGDSIVNHGRQQLQDTARRAYYVSDVYAVDGYHIKDVDGEVVQDLNDHPDTFAVVINAGTNDAAQDTPTWSIDYDSLLGHANVPCVVVTTINTLVDLADPLTPTARLINTYLRAQVASHSGYRLVDWDGEVQSGDPVLLSDGVHPNEQGKQWLADRSVAAVQSCESASTTTTTSSTSSTTVPTSTTSTSTSTSTTVP